MVTVNLSLFDVVSKKDWYRDIVKMEVLPRIGDELAYDDGTPFLKIFRVVQVLHYVNLPNQPIQVVANRDIGD
jgi:hypothetical protein